jgi:signal peptidase II
VTARSTSGRWPLQPTSGLWLLASAFVVLLDQWTKHLIVVRFAEYDSIVLLPFLEFMRLHNEGAAFSFLAQASGWQRWMFVGLGSVVSGGIAIWLLRLPARHRLLASALSLVMGGALGNVIDRIRFGYVVDFIRVHYAQWYFPAFNVADSAITIGAALLILDSLLQSRRTDGDSARPTDTP